METSILLSLAMDFDTHKDKQEWTISREQMASLIKEVQSITKMISHDH